MTQLLYLLNQRLPTEKAYGIQTVHMCEAFAKNGLSVKLIAPKRGKPITSKSLFDFYGIDEIFSFESISAPDFYWPWPLEGVSFILKQFLSGISLVRRAQRIGPSLIYTRDESVAYFCSFFSAHVCFEAHTYSKKKNLIYKELRRKKVKIVTITRELKNEFLNLGFSESQILVAPDGVDMEKFNIPLSKNEARKKLGFPLDKNIVMYSGHLFTWKGADILIEALRYLHNVIIVLIGGTDSDLKDFRYKYSGNQDVLILGNKPHADIPSYLKASDVLVLPNSGKEVISHKYTSPLKLFEYMASGRPIVASSLPSIREILHDDNSVLVDSDNPKSLAKGIESIINNLKKGEAISHRALSDVRQYDWSFRAKKILNFFK